jgi:hypothetical protein
MESDTISCTSAARKSESAWLRISGARSAPITQICVVWVINLSRPRLMASSPGSFPSDSLWRFSGIPPSKARLWNVRRAMRFRSTINSQSTKAALVSRNLPEASFTRRVSIASPVGPYFHRCMKRANSQYPPAPDRRTNTARPVAIRQQSTARLTLHLQKLVHRHHVVGEIGHDDHRAKDY